MEKSETVKSGDGFIDRSKVRILLCDNDVKSSEEILTLLCGCSYQVTAVKSPRQVIDALNAEGPDIDIILSEVDLPMSKGLKMLKYIMRDKELRRIPLIMMSARDEVPIVVRCLKFGAADFLVKPLRRNELLNLWTHMWRKRRMLGLVEKNIISYDFDLVRSDHSDANTNSSTSFSDDADEDESRNPKMCESIHHEDEANTTRGALVATTIQTRPQCPPDICNRRTGQILPFPKKRQLKIGESSAFFTYIKATTSRSENPPQHVSIVDNHISNEVGSCIQGEKTRETAENPSPPDNPPSNNGAHESSLMERSIDISQMHLGNDVAGCYSHTAYPYYMSGVINQVIPGMASYSYYPFGISLQPGQMPGPHPCPSFGNSTFDKVDHREAALMKFRQKRKERCFGKKIRYVNRKKLAECRPRLRGQFVRKVKVDLNGQPGDDEEEEQEYDEEDQTAAAMELSPQDDASMFQ